jgi:hypothetical protein
VFKKPEHSRELRGIVAHRQSPMIGDNMSEWPPWLTRRELSDYLRIVHGMKFGVAALANAATDGTGPPFVKQGRKLVSYHRPDADLWARGRMSRKVRSTSELREDPTRQLPPAA